jgi:ATP-dependent helicase/nuclease subunit A
MANNWTREQLEAITDRDCNLLVAAAAGAGKTAVLVERIIRKITDPENPVDIDKLLVVTFTNAAATEMRERIGEALAEALESDPSSANLQKQMALLDRASIMTLHSFCLEVVRSNFHALDLDPLFRIADETESSLMRLEALDRLFESKYENEDSGSLFFRLVESYGGSRDDSLLRDTVMTLHRFTRSHPYPERWLAEQAEAYNAETNASVCSTPWARVLLSSAAAELQGLMDMLDRAKEQASLAEGLEPYCGTLENDMNVLENILSLCSETIKKADEAFGKARACGEPDIESAQTADLAWNDLYNAFASCEFARLPRCGKDADKTAQEEVKAIRNTVRERLKKLQASGFDVSCDEIREDFRKLYPQLKYLSGMVSEFDGIYRQMKKEKGVLDFNDLEHYCLQILLEDGVPTAAAKELRKRYEEILIDEYQDSNLIQEIIISVVSGNEDDIFNIFMVGDVKQSIYRFRQARPDLFLSKYQNYHRGKGHENRVIQLYKNFRSRCEVINAVNFIFRQIMSPEVGELDYTVQEYLNPGAVFPVPEHSCTAGGPVELHILDLSSEANEIMPDGTGEPDEEADGNPEENGKAHGTASSETTGDGASNTSDSGRSGNNDRHSVNGSSYDSSGSAEDDGIEEADEEPLDNIQYEARMVGNIVRRLVTYEPDGFNVYDKKRGAYRPVEYRDIVILMRTTMNWADVFVDELALMGIPVYADTGLGYFRTVEVETMLSLLRIIDNPLQDIPMLAVLRSPISGFSTDDLADIRLAERSASIYEAMRKLAGSADACTDVIQRTRDFLTKLDRWRDAAQYTPTDELVWQLLSETGYYSYVGALPGGAERKANLRMLFERARQYEETSYRGLFNFINFINRLRSGGGDMGSAKILGENDNVVRIMSIHKSKGLEFPVVIVAGCGKKFNMQDLNASILLHQDLGFGPDVVDLEKRTIIPSLPKFAIRQKLRLETLSEEMRILYVAFTRAREKLIITGSIRDHDKVCSSWRMKAAGTAEKLSSFDMMQASTYLDWIGPAVMKPGFSVMKPGPSVMEPGPSVESHEDKPLLEIRFWGTGAARLRQDEPKAAESIREWLRDIHGQEAGEQVESAEKTEKPEEQKGLPAGPEREATKRDQEAVRHIIDALEWTYPYQKLTTVPAKISVTELKRRAVQDDAADSAAPFIQPMQERPLFMEPEKDLSAAHKGTVMHFVMQHLDLGRLSEAAAMIPMTAAEHGSDTDQPDGLVHEISQQLTSMKDNELLTEAEAESVNPAAVAAFFRSPLGRRMLAAHRSIHRETAFTIDIKCSEVLKDLEDNETCNEMMLLQGVIDCWFETEDGIVLVDYKTDYVPKGRADIIRDRYRVQIDYYTKALEKITSKKVSERYLYLFSSGELVEY